MSLESNISTILKFYSCFSMLVLIYGSLPSINNIGKVERIDMEKSEFIYPMLLSNYKWHFELKKRKLGRQKRSSYQSRISLCFSSRVKTVNRIYFSELFVFKYTKPPTVLYREFLFCQAFEQPGNNLHIAWKKLLRKCWAECSWQQKFLTMILNYKVLDTFLSSS